MMGLLQIRSDTSGMDASFGYSDDAFTLHNALR